MIWVTVFERTPLHKNARTCFQMFVGQVPRSMDENDLRLMFEEFGRVHQINVLRDKITGASKGLNLEIFCGVCMNLSNAIINNLYKKRTPYATPEHFCAWMCLLIS